MSKATPPLESVIHSQVCKYLDLQYPNLIYLTDASGVRMPIGLATKFAKLKCKKYKIPDLIILHPNCGFHGLIIEIKREYSQVFKKDGTLVSNEHIKAQHDSLDKLCDLGYAAYFGYGFEGTKLIIDGYLEL